MRVQRDPTLAFWGAGWKEVDLTGLTFHELQIERGPRNQPGSTLPLPHKALLPKWLTFPQAFLRHQFPELHFCI